MLDTIARLGNRGVQALQGIGSSGLFYFPCCSESLMF